MKVSLSWLKEFLDLTADADQVAEALTLSGLEVEGQAEIPGDTIFEISLTPNLGHCMSTLGVARELAAFFEIPCKLPSFSFAEKGDRLIEEALAVTVEEGKNCARYACRIIEGVNVGPSPEWLVKRLEESGFRSINNVVDVTNYVMLELGQPLHAFDLNQIEGDTIIVTSSASYKEMQTLDGVQRDLPKGGLLICDKKGPLAIAGVIGGERASVTNGTTRILVEAASFSSTSIRKTGKWLGLRTDSSMRFEKGIDPLMVPFALDRAVSLLQKLGGGQVAKGRIDKIQAPFVQKTLTCRLSRVNELMGTRLSLSEISSFLKRLQFEIVNEENNAVCVKVPLFRNDVNEEIDLIEEIARIFGFNNIPLRPEKYTTSVIPHAPMYLFEKEIRERLISEGLGEWITCDLISPKLASLGHSKKEALITVLKPASSDQSVLRTSLLPGMLQAVKNNIDRGTLSLASFEVGRIHFKDKDRFIEESCAAVILTGSQRPYHWHPKPQPFDFFDLKGVVENLLEGLRLESTVFEESRLPHFHPKRQALIVSDGKTMGVIGEIHPNTAKVLDIEQRLFFSELNLSRLFECKKREKACAPLPLYPSSSRDLTITLKNEVSLDRLLNTINGHKCPYLEKIIFLDLYKSDQIGKDRKNITLRFVYRDRAKTIALETVEKEHALITENVMKAFKF